MRGGLFVGLRVAFLVGMLGSLGAAPVAGGGVKEVGKMTVGELLAEFHGHVEMVVPASQRRVDVINGLRRAGLPLVEILRKEMGDGDAGVRRRAVIVAAYLGKGARPLVLELMTAAEKEEGLTRTMALGILCRLREPCALDLILRAAHDPVAGVRGVIVRDGAPALADAPFAVAVLALKDPDVNVRAMAVRNLMMLKDTRAVVYLLPVLEDEVVMNYDVREGVKTASRPCDEAARALEYLVDGVYLVGEGKTQAELDARVAKWRAWGKEKGAGFDAALYVEGEMVRALE